MKSIIYYRRVKDRACIKWNTEPNASDEKSIMPNITGITEYHYEYQSN